MGHQTIHILNSENLEQRHLELCAQDVAKLATLMVADSDHRTFTRRASLSRRYNQEYLPDPALSIDTLFDETLTKQPRNFAQAFEAAQRGPRVILSDKSYDEVVQRVLADSSPYLETIANWMERNRTAGNFAQYTDPTQAIRLLRNRTLRNEGQLETLIRQGMEKLGVVVPKP